MILLLMLWTFPLKIYTGLSGGIGLSHSLAERKDAPYGVNPNATIDGVLGGEIGISLLSIVNLTGFGRWEGPGIVRHPHDRDKNNRRDEWNDFSYGGQITITFPLKGNLFGKGNMKYGKIGENCRQVDETLYNEEFYYEEYEYLGYWPEVSLLLDLPKEHGQLEFIYEHQDLGTIALKEKVSGKTYYKKLTINRFYFGFNTPAAYFPKQPKKTEWGRAGLGVSFTSKTDGRIDVFLMMKGILFTSFTSDTVFTNRF